MEENFREVTLGKLRRIFLVLYAPQTHPNARLYKINIFLAPPVES